MVALRYGWVAGFETHTLITSDLTLPYFTLPYLTLLTYLLYLLTYPFENGFLYQVDSVKTNE